MVFQTLLTRVPLQQIRADTPSQHPTLASAGSSMPKLKTIVDNVGDNVVSLYHFTIYSLQKAAEGGE